MCYVRPIYTKRKHNQIALEEIISAHLALFIILISNRIGCYSQLLNSTIHTLLHPITHEIRIQVGGSPADDDGLVMERQGSGNLGIWLPQIGVLRTTAVGERPGTYARIHPLSGSIQRRVCSNSNQGGGPQSISSLHLLIKDQTKTISILYMKMEWLLHNIIPHRYVHIYVWQ